MEHEPSVTIVGAGIAGLYAALRLTRPGTIIEAYKRPGGRISTWRYKHPVTGAPFSVEAGAGRLASTHTRLTGLLARFRLTHSPISGCWGHIKTTAAAPTAQSPLSILPRGLKETTSTIVSFYESRPNTLRKSQSLQKNIRKDFGLVFADTYRLLLGQDSELDIMAPDAALLTLKDDFTASEQAGIKEGQTELVVRLTRYLKGRGWRFLLGESVTNVSGIEGEWLVETPRRLIMTPRVIVATPPSVARTFSVAAPLSKHQDSFVATPLMRIYAIQPMEGGRAWWSGMTKTTTDSPLGMIIPINPQQGLIMISYTDGERARVLKSQIDADGVASVVASHLRSVFPRQNIPDALWIRDQYWKEGVWQWRVGGGGAESVRRIQSQYDTLQFVGEPLSAHQAWVEGALESVDKYI